MVTLDVLLASLRSMGLSDRCDALGDIFLDRDLGNAVPLKDSAKLLRDAGIPSTIAITIRDSLVAGTPMQVQLYLCNLHAVLCVCFSLRFTFAFSRPARRLLLHQRVMPVCVLLLHFLLTR